jgi:hypothetical protein
LQIIASSRKVTLVIGIAISTRQLVAFIWTDRNDRRKNTTEKLAHPNNCRRVNIMFGVNGVRSQLAVN